MKPPFDDSRKALEFALNAHEVQMPRPAMNKAMAAGIKKVQSKAAAKRAKKAAEAAGTPIKAELSRRHDHAAEARREARAQWLGLKPAAQAGLILLEFNKLEREHRIVLSGLLMRSHVPCSCRAPCCSGMASQMRWVHAVNETCQLLKESIDLVRVPGKKGLSSQPWLRRRVVEDFYTKQETPTSNLARISEVSIMTAAKHRAWILEGLERIETEAWLQIDAMFDAAGITGTIVD